MASRTISPVAMIVMSLPLLARRIQNRVVLARVHADGHRAGNIDAAEDDLLELVGICRCADRHVDQRRKQRHILHRVMRRAGVSGQTGIVRDDAHRQIRIAAVCPHLFQAAHAHKRHHADDERDIALHREAGSHAYHALLGNAGVDEALGVRLFEVIAAPADIRRQKPDSFVVFRKLRDRVAYDGPAGVINVQSIRFSHAYASFSRS